MLVGVESQCGHLLCPHQKHRLSWSGWRRWGLAYRWRKHILQRNWSQGTKLSWQCNRTETQNDCWDVTPVNLSAAWTEMLMIQRTLAVKGGACYSSTQPTKGNAATDSTHRWKNEWRLVGEEHVQQSRWVWDLFYDITDDGSSSLNVSRIKLECKALTEHHRFDSHISCNTGTAYQTCQALLLWSLNLDIQDMTCYDLKSLIWKPNFESSPVRGSFT